MSIAAFMAALAYNKRANEDALLKAKKKLGQFTVAELSGATVNKYEVPDLSNPGGYYDCWVVLERRVFFDLFKVDTILFFEPTCSECGEVRQQEVYNYAYNLVSAVSRS